MCMHMWLLFMTVIRFRHCCTGFCGMGGIVRTCCSYFLNGRVVVVVVVVIGDVFVTCSAASTHPQRSCKPACAGTVRMCTRTAHCNSSGQANKGTSVSLLHPAYAGRAGQQCASVLRCCCQHLKVYVT